MCRDTPLMKTLTRGGCPNGEPFGARSEFCRVTPHSSAFFGDFFVRKQKSYCPAGGSPGIRKQPPNQNKNKKEKEPNAHGI